MENNYSIRRTAPKNNMIVRTAMSENGIALWLLAEILGISESTIVRWMRKEHSKDEQLRIAEMISEYAKSGEQNNG